MTTKNNKKSCVEKELLAVKELLTKVVKNFGRTDLDWTVQFSVNSTSPDKINYCAQVEAPANGLAPVTWVFDECTKLKNSLKESAKNLNVEAVNKAWHEGEIARCEALIKYHQEELAKDTKENKSDESSEKEV